jgi:hypothetical protein
MLILIAVFTLAIFYIGHRLLIKETEETKLVYGEICKDKFFASQILKRY